MCCAKEHFILNFRMYLFSECEQLELFFFFFIGWFDYSVAFVAWIDYTSCFFFNLIIVQTDFRFYWLQTKLQEEPLVTQVSTQNPVSGLIICFTYTVVHLISPLPLYCLIWSHTVSVHHLSVQVCQSASLSLWWHVHSTSLVRCFFSIWGTWTC